MRSTAGTVEAGSAEVAAGGANSMEALEAAVAPGTQLPGFVSAGVVQPGKSDQAAAGLSHPKGASPKLIKGDTAYMHQANAMHDPHPEVMGWMQCSVNLRGFGNLQLLVAAEAEANPEDIDLGDEDAMEEDDIQAVQEKAVPVRLFVPFEKHAYASVIAKFWLSHNCWQRPCIAQSMQASQAATNAAVP